MATPERVKTEELQRALATALSPRFGERKDIAIVHRRHSRYSSSFPIETLGLRLAGPRSLSLIFKDSSPGSLLESARRIRPRFLYHPAREIEVYRRVLDPARFGTATFYGAVARPELGRYWLFLERVRGPLLWQVGRIESWREAARWLGGLHSYFAQDSQTQGTCQLAPLLHYDRRLLTQWWTRAESFLAGTGLRSARDGCMLRSFIRLTERHERVIDRLLSLADTFIHGEFYPSNVIVRRQGTVLRICPIDWEVAAIGPGLIDVAALTSGAWSADQRKTMIAAYREALEPRRGSPLSLPELMEAVQYCKLHLAVQWLGWAADWSPPKMHARDWLREAVTLSTALGIQA